MLSFLTPVWVVSGFESSATIAEEASNAARAVPFAMVSSLVTATITGWALIITIAFCMGQDAISLVTSPLGQPMAQIAYNSLGDKGSIALLTFLWISSICNCSILMVANTIAINSIFNLAIMGLYFVRLCTDMKFLLSWLLC
jgi:amino acid transporter